MPDPMDEATGPRNEVAKLREAATRDEAIVAVMSGLMKQVTVAKETKA